MFTVRADLVKAPSLPAERDREEKAALDRLLPLLTPEQKAFVVADLNDPRHKGGGSVTSVPHSQEVADLLATIYAIRDARTADARLVEQQEWGRQIGEA